MATLRRPKRRMSRYYNVALTNEVYQKLSRLARTEGVSRGAMIRILVQRLKEGALHLPRA